MEMASNNKKIMSDYDVATEEIVNFIDNLIVNKILEKIEEQKKSTDDISNHLKSLSETADEIEKESTDNKKNAKDILKLLLEDSDDREILDDEIYAEFDIVKHSEWEKKEITKLGKRPIYDRDLLFEQITNESNRIKSEIIKEILEKLSYESVNQQDKVQKIAQILLNQNKKAADFLSDEYNNFDIVDKTNALERNIRKLVEHENLFEEKIQKILVRKEGETQPDYFDSIENAIKASLEEKKEQLTVILNKIEEDVVQESTIIKHKLDDCESKNTQITEDIRNISELMDERYNVASAKANKFEKKMKIWGSIIIILQIITMVVAYFN